MTIATLEQYEAVKVECASIVLTALTIPRWYELMSALNTYEEEQYIDSLIPDGV